MDILKEIKEFESNIVEYENEIIRKNQEIARLKQWLEDRKQKVEMLKSKVENQITISEIEKIGTELIDSIFNPKLNIEFACFENDDNYNEIKIYYNNEVARNEFIDKYADQDYILAKIKEMITEDLMEQLLW